MYLCLFAKYGRTRKGKQHVTTAPVKLILAKNPKQQSHPRTKFARGTTINVLEELAGLLKPGDFIFHSQDDIAKVPIGLTDASKKDPLLMHM